MTLFVILLIFAGLIAWAVIVERLDRQAVQASIQRERMRIRHEEFVAERRLQAMTQQAFQHLLDEARSADDGSAPVRERDHP